MASTVFLIDPVFQGSDGTNAGTSGYVPAPAATDNTKYLKGDGTWAEVQGGGGGGGSSGVIWVEGSITNTSGSYTGTFNDSRITSDMKCLTLELGAPGIFNDDISVACSSGFITISCSEVAGTSTFKASFIASLLSSTEYTALNTSKADKVTSATAGNVATLDSNGNLVDSGKTLGKSVPSDAVFTDTTYSAATQSADGLMSSSDKTKLDGIATGATAVTVSNSLSDSSTTNALSAAKGKELSEQIGTINSNKATGASSSTSNGVVLFSGTDGKTLANSGKTITDVTSSTAIGSNANIPTNRTVRNAIYNGLNKTAAGFALDARQGAKLNKVQHVFNGGVTTVTITTTDTLDSKMLFLVMHKNSDSGLSLVSGNGVVNNIVNSTSAGITASVSGNTITLTGNNLYYGRVTVISGVEFTLAAGS